MAKRISINKPMVDALERLRQITKCDLCKQEIEYHSYIDFQGSGIVGCSNARKEEGK